MHMVAKKMRTRTYIAFDGDADLMSYRTIQRWSCDEAVPFTLNDAHDVNYARDDSLPESIINQLRERLDVSKNIVLIIGSVTCRNRKGILDYELRYALKHRLPIFLVFKGYTAETRNDKRLWDRLHPLIPSLIRKWPAELHCLVRPFTQNAVCQAIQRFSHVSLPEGKKYTWWWK